MAATSRNFDEPRSPSTLLQLKRANEIHRKNLGAICRAFPRRMPWSVQIVTDWGNDGKRLEAAVWNFCGRKKGASVYELSHHVQQYSITEAALLFESKLPLALPNTVFLCVVDPGVGSDRKAIAVQAGNNSFFVGPHNGVFDLVLRGLNKLYGIKKVVEIANETRHVISTAEGAIQSTAGDALFAPVAGAIVKHGGIPSGIGKGIPLQEFGEVLGWEYAHVDAQGWITGKIEGVDHYGTFVTNIPESCLENVKPGSRLLVIGKKFKEIKLTYATHFEAVGNGEPLALAQGNGFLHLAVNRGRAIDKLDLRAGEHIVLLPPGK